MTPTPSTPACQPSTVLTLQPLPGSVAVWCRPWTRPACATSSSHPPSLIRWCTMDCSWPTSAAAPICEASVADVSVSFPPIQSPCATIHGAFFLENSHLAHKYIVFFIAWFPHMSPQLGFRRLRFLHCVNIVSFLSDQLEVKPKMNLFVRYSCRLYISILRDTRSEEASEKT